MKYNIEFFAKLHSIVTFEYINTKKNETCIFNYAIDKIKKKIKKFMLIIIIISFTSFYGYNIFLY